MTIDKTTVSFLWVPVILAGLYGGLSEVFWVAIYSYFAPLEAAEIARHVALTVFPSLADSSAATILGITIHFALSLAIAVAFTRLVWIPWAKRGATHVFAGALAALVIIWAVNFLVLLPALNPVFVALMPYMVTLFSKMLFGLAMASGLRVHYRAHVAHPYVTALNLQTR